MEITGTITAQLGWTDTPVTVKDVRRWLEKVEQLGVHEDVELSVCNLELEVVLPVVDVIECGNCAPQRTHVGYTIWGEECG